MTPKEKQEAIESLSNNIGDVLEAEGYMLDWEVEQEIKKLAKLVITKELEEDEEELEDDDDDLDEFDDDFEMDDDN